MNEPKICPLLALADPGYHTVLVSTAKGNSAPGLMRAAVLLLPLPVAWMT